MNNTFAKKKCPSDILPILAHHFSSIRKCPLCKSCMSCAKMYKKYIYEHNFELYWLGSILGILYKKFSPPHQRTTFCKIRHHCCTCTHVRNESEPTYNQLLHQATLCCWYVIADATKCSKVVTATSFKILIKFLPNSPLRARR